jgi:hypothetical protein
MHLLSGVYPITQRPFTRSAPSGHEHLPVSHSGKGLQSDWSPKQPIVQLQISGHTELVVVITGSLVVVQTPISHFSHIGPT